MLFDITEQQLLGIIGHGPESLRLASLETLQLDMAVPGERGTCLEEVGYQLCSWTEDGVYDDWVLPNWPPRFDGRALQHVVAAAKQRKPEVEIKGNVLEAMALQEEFVDQVTMAEEMMAMAMEAYEGWESDYEYEGDEDSEAE